MGMQLDEVILWGRSYNQYQQMFSLTEADLKKRIIGVADGPASTNAELRPQGIDYTSLDPIYALSPDQIRDQFESKLPDVFEQVKLTIEEKQRRWTDNRTTQDIENECRSIFSRFLEDFEGQGAGKAYRTGELPNLPFDDGSFDIALCSHLLFVYQKVLSQAFHIESLTDMLRIANEVRVFPITDIDGECQSDYLEPVIEHFVNEGYQVRVKAVPFTYIEIEHPFEMLVIRRIS